MTTYEQIYDRAYNRSNYTRPTNVNEDGELLDVAYRALREAWATAMRIRPTFFGAISTPVAHDTTGWPRPTDADRVHRIVDGAGAEIVTVDINDPDQQTGMPAVIEYGRYYLATGFAGDPTAAASLVFYYGRFPVRPGAKTEALDGANSLWLEEFDPLVELPVAIYLAVKDSAKVRAPEIVVLETELEKWRALFAEHVATATQT